MARSRNILVDFLSLNILDIPCDIFTKLKLYIFVLVLTETSLLTEPFNVLLNGFIRKL